MSILKKKSFTLTVAIGLGAALIFTALLLLPTALLIHKEVLDLTAGWLCAALAAGLGVFVSTAVIVKVRGRQALATGGALALGYVLLAALLCALGGSGFSFGAWLIRLSCAVAAGGLAGAMVSIGKNTRRKSRR